MSVPVMGGEVLGEGRRGKTPLLLLVCQVDPKGVALTQFHAKGPAIPFPQEKPGHQGLMCSLQVFQDWQRILTF